MKSNHVVIDNFLDQEEFEPLAKFVMKELVWAYNKTVSFEGEVSDEKSFYMSHYFYGLHHRPTNDLEKFLTLPWSDSIHLLAPLLNKLNPTLVMRIKANLFPNTPKILEHNMHADFDYHHCAGLFSLNTCDGYTKLEDGTRVNSVANRMLIFDSSEQHCATTTTNATARWNINTNFLGVEGF